MGKRYIRLKELTPGTDTTHIPTAQQMGYADDTLAEIAYRSRVDANGFMLTGNTVQPGPPIVFIGDSFVESMFAAEDVRFVSQVERTMGVKCHNAGYSGSSSLQLLNSLINKVYASVGPGATVVFFAPHSDRDNIYVEGRYWNNLPRGASILPAGSAGHHDIPEGVASVDAILRIVVAACHHLGMHLILATAPFRIADFSTDQSLRSIYARDRTRYEMGLARRFEFCAAVRKVATETGARLLDVEDALHGDPSLFYDELHLNKAGHDRISELITTELSGLAAPSDAAQRFEWRKLLAAIPSFRA